MNVLRLISQLIGIETLRLTHVSKYKYLPTVSKQSTCYAIILSISFPIKNKKNKNKLFMKTKRVEVKLKVK